LSGGRGHQLVVGTEWRATVTPRHPRHISERVLSQTELGTSHSRCDNRPMTEDEFLKRFDEHLSFCKELLARNDAAIEDDRAERRQAQVERERAQAEQRQAQAEHRQALIEHRQALIELREADAEHREAHAAHMQEMRDVRFELKQMSLRGERVAQGFITILQDLVEESRAQRQALFAMIDQLKGDGPAPAGA
jgi:hypothetical protein